MEWKTGTRESYWKWNCAVFRTRTSNDPKRIARPQVQSILGTDFCFFLKNWNAYFISLRTRINSQVGRVIVTRDGRRSSVYNTYGRGHCGTKASTVPDRLADCSLNFVEPSCVVNSTRRVIIIRSSVKRGVKSSVYTPLGSALYLTCIWNMMTPP